MVYFTSINKQESYVELTTKDGEKHIIPANSIIYVEDGSGMVSIKNTASRKTIGLISEEAYHKNPDEPEHYKVWGYLTDGSVYVIPENGDSSLTSDEVSQYKDTMATANIGTGVTTIENSCFKNIPTLTSLTISDSVETIKGWAFNKTGLKDVKIGSGLTSVGGHNFEQVLSIEKLYINCKNINFSFCEAGYSGSLTEVVFGKNVEIIGGYFSGPLTSLTIPSNVKALNAYFGLPNLQEIILNEGLEEMHASIQYAQITTVTIPNSVKIFTGQIFRGCKYLETAIFGNSLEKFGDPFISCKKLKTVIIKTLTPSECEGYYAPFNYDLNAELKIYVPDESVDAYKAASEWSNVADRIKPISEYDGE